MAQQENNINRKLAIKWSSIGGRLWRITPGLLWIGQVVEEFFVTKKNNKRIKCIEMMNARPIKMFKKGMPDNLGFEPVEITADMVGEKLPVFCMIEVKTKRYKKITDEQREKLNAFTKLGARCYLAREDDSAEGYNIERWENVSLR